MVRNGAVGGGASEHVRGIEAFSLSSSPRSRQSNYITVFYLVFRFQSVSTCFILHKLLLRPENAKAECL